MSSVKVIDLNETANGSLNSKVGVETDKQDLPQIEEVQEEEHEVAVEEVSKPAEEESKPTEKVKQTPKEKAKAKAQQTVECNTCDKKMTYKNFRYYHDEHCSEDKIEYKPIKKQANPKGKAKPKQPPEREASRRIREPKPAPETYYTDSSSEEEVIVRKKKKEQAREATSEKRVATPPTNPLTDITNHYQLLHQQLRQQKQEKYNNLCQSMFSAKSKKR